jgi:hypothetical protein
MVEPTPLPIACTLTGASLQERAAWLSRLGDAALVEGRRDGDRLQLRFRAPAADDVRELVRAEGECCPFLDFRVREAAGEVRLTVSGAPAAGPVLDDILAALQAGHGFAAPEA